MPRVSGAPLPMQNRAGRPAPTMPRRRRDSKVAVLLVSIVYSLLIARVIIPGSFDYDPNTNILAVAARDAVFNKTTWLSFLLIPVALMASRSTLALRLV